MIFAHCDYYIYTRSGIKGSIDGDTWRLLLEEVLFAVAISSMLLELDSRGGLEWFWPFTESRSGWGGAGGSINV